MKPEQQADVLVTFYRRLIDGNVDENAAGVLTIELNKTLCAQGVDPASTSSDDVERAAEAKRQKRRAELGR